MDPAPQVIKTETLIASTAVVFLLDPLLIGLFQALALPKFLGIGLARLVQTLSLLALVLYFQQSLTVLGFPEKGLRNGLVRGAVWSGITALITFGCFGLLFVAGVNPLALFRNSLPPSSLDTAYYFIAGGLAAPLAEEVYFRGVLFRFLRSRGFVFALVVSTAVFAGAHVLFSGRFLPLTQIAGGLLFAWAFEKEQSLWVPMVIHSTGNIAMFTLSLV